MSFHFRLQPQIYKPAHCFGPAGQIFLLTAFRSGWL
jgi:hypothetical protein